MKRRPWEGFGHEVDGVSRPATNVGDIDTVPQAFDQAGHEWKRDVEQCRVVHCAAILGHQALELRELRIRHAAAVVEAVDDLVFDQGHESDVLRLHREVVGTRRSGQPRSALRR